MSGHSEAVRSNEEEDGVSMLDVLKEEEKLEEDAHAVLGGSDVASCTYDKGYLARQPLYSCATCETRDTKPAGICLACSLECHEGHSLYELYTKRNFRCDCGNEKFVSAKCKLTPVRDVVNIENRYSQNFNGLYCVCHRPYPDPEDHEEDEMLQCCVCEDWFHSRHLGVTLPEEDFDEMICESCMERNDFLYNYTSLYPQFQGKAQKMVNEPTEKEVSVEIEGADNSKVTNGETEEAPLNQMKETVQAGSSSTMRELSHCKDSHEKKSKSYDSLEKIRHDSLNSPSTSGKQTERSEGKGECKLQQLKASGYNLLKQGSSFWPEGWRSKLCTCALCEQIYYDLDVSFLKDTNDTIKCYESRNHDNSVQSTQYETGMRALQNMDRVQQVEVMTEFNSMKSELTEYLKKFAENKKMVREEDIKEFFEQLKARKRARTQMQHFFR